MSISRYTLNVATFATTRVPQRLVLIPACATVFVESDQMQLGGTVSVEWNGMRATMFTDDLLSRASALPCIDSGTGKTQSF